MNLPDAPTSYIRPKNIFSFFLGLGGKRGSYIPSITVIHTGIHFLMSQDDIIS